MKRVSKLIFIGLLVFPQSPMAMKDVRQLVEMPQKMRGHMLVNMRNHLEAVHQTQLAIADDDWDKAAQIVESSLGMSSLNAHGAEHMAPFMPKEMRELGSQMHKYASQFALKAQEVDVKGKTNDAQRAFAKVLGQCVACHGRYRVH
jgi:mono/diheme cytochrome c family protein